MTQKQQTIRAHNVGHNMPMLTHADYVSWLYEAAKRWTDVDPKKAREVLYKAQRADKHPEDCPVCKAHGLMED